MSYDVSYFVDDVHDLIRECTETDLREFYQILCFRLTLNKNSAGVFIGRIQGMLKAAQKAKPDLVNWLSKKLRARTWIALAAFHASIAVVSFWAYQAKAVPESAIPPVYHAALEPVPLPAMKAHWKFAWSYEALIVRPGLAWSWAGVDSTDYDLHSFDRGHMMPRSTYEHDFSLTNLGSSTHFHIAIVLAHEPAPFGFPFPELPDLARTVVQIPTLDAPSLFTSFERTIALVSTIITSALAILNLFLAWQIFRRSRAEAILLRLQIEKLTLENERLREEFDKAKGQTEKSGIILLS